MGLGLYLLATGLVPGEGFFSLCTFMTGQPMVIMTRPNFMTGGVNTINIMILSDHLHDRLVLYNFIYGIPHFHDGLSHFHDGLSHFHDGSVQFHYVNIDLLTCTNLLNQLVQNCKFA